MHSNKCYMRFFFKTRMGERRLSEEGLVWMLWRFSGEPRIFKNVEKLEIRCIIRYDYKRGLRIVFKMVVSCEKPVVSLGLKKNWDKAKKKNKHTKERKKLHTEMSSILKGRNKQQL